MITFAFQGSKPKGTSSTSWTRYASVSWLLFARSGRGAPLHGAATLPLTPPPLCSRPPQRRGKKALIVDPSLSGPLSMLDMGLSEMLAEHGVAKCVTRLHGAARRGAAHGAEEGGTACCLLLLPPCRGQQLRFLLL